MWSSEVREFGRKALAAQADGCAVPWYLPVRAFPARVTLADPLANSGPRTRIVHSAGPVGSARSAPRELRDRCRLGLIDSKIESADELHLFSIGPTADALKSVMSPAEVNEALRPAAANPRA